MNLLRAGLAALTFVALAACTTAPSRPQAAAPAVSADQTTPPAHDNLNATLWMQSAAEYKATVRGIYAAARHSLDRALDDPNWNALPAGEFQTGFEAKPPAIVVDADETMIDNSAFQARAVIEDAGYSRERWLEWVNALKAAALLAFVGAALVALYTGAEVAVVQARPLWNTPLLPLQFFVTAFAGAVGLALLFNRFGPDDAAASRRMAGVLAASQVVALAVGALWLALGVCGISPVHAQALAEVGPSANWQLSAVWAVAATVLTLVLAWKWPGSGLLIGLLALHSAWMMRWSIFIGGQEVPKTGAGYYTYSLPLGPEGLMGIVGTAGLWVFLFVLITTLLPLDRLAAGTPDKAAA